MFVVPPLGGVFVSFSEHANLHRRLETQLKQLKGTH